SCTTEPSEIHSLDSRMEQVKQGVPTCLVSSEAPDLIDDFDKNLGDLYDASEQDVPIYLCVPYDMRIPARSQVKVKLKTSDSVCLPSSVIEAYQPFTDKTGLVFPSVIVESSGESEPSVEIWMSNPTTTDKKLFGGTKVAEVLATVAENEETSHPNSRILVRDQNDKLHFDQQALEEIREMRRKQFDPSKIKMGTLPPDQKKKLVDLLTRYADCFSADLSTIGRTNLTEAHIDMQGSSPIYQYPYKTALKEKQIIDEQIKTFIDNAIAYPTISECTSPVVLVKKRDASI